MNIKFNIKISFIFWAVCLLISVSSNSFAKTEENELITIEVPKGTTITIDGKMDKDEWKEALTQELKGGGQIKLKHDGNFLLIGLQDGKPSLTNDVLKDESLDTMQINQIGGLSHIYLFDGKDIYVLHASASLGMAIYRQKDDLWQPFQKFNWDLKGKSSESEDGKVYLDKNGWLANVASNLKTEREYKIAMKFREFNEFRLAAVYITNPIAPQVFPKTVSDDTLKMELLFGGEPNNLNFKNEQWAVIKLKEK